MQLTDVAVETEDVGAGMSVSWLDYDADGAEDIHVAEHCGPQLVCVSPCRTLSKRVRRRTFELNIKNMRQLLLRNAGSTFKDITSSSGTGIGVGIAAIVGFRSRRLPGYLHCKRNGLWSIAL